jgi:hypothetical protein
MFSLVLARSALSAGVDGWTNSSGGLWRVGSNWSSNQPPNSTFTAVMITNAASKTVTIDAGTGAANLSAPRLTVSSPAGSLNSLSLVDVTTNLPLQVAGLLTVDRASLTLTNSAVNSIGALIDHGGAVNVTNSVLSESGVLSTFDINNGSAWLDSGLINCSAISAVRIGRTNNGTGTLTVAGGTVLAPQVEVAASTASSGVLNVAGGLLNASSLFTVGYGVNSSGTVSVSGGQLIATNAFSYVGKSGMGLMTISGGNASFASLSVGNNANGQLSLTGGQLTMIPRDTNDWLQIGGIGVGQFNMSGGTVLALGEIHVGDDASGLGTGSGTAMVSGGQIIATSDTTAIGRFGPGQMTITNASAWLTNVSVGRHDGAVGTLTVQSNAQMYLLDALSIGRFSNAVGHVFIEGGLLSLTNDAVWVGREGIGDMTISTGTVRAAATFVALSTVVPDPITLAPVTNSPTGTLTLAGGNLVLTSNLLVGSSSISTGHVFVTGGSLSVTGNGNSGYLLVSGGDFNLSHGSVAVDNLFVTNVTGQFVFSGGLLQARNLVVANGSPFVVGDGINPATLQLEGGVYSFADGLIVSNNAVVTGCGTIMGNISNFGTLATNCASTSVSIVNVTKTGSRATIFFTTLSGLNHVLEFKNALTDPAWTAILPGVIGLGGVTNTADPNATASSRFYRIHVQ